MVEFKILIIENNDEQRASMLEALKASFQTEAVKTGKEGVGKIAIFKPDLVLIDFQVTDMSSVQVQQEIAKIDSNIHSVMISNVDRSKISLQSMKKRAMDYIYRSDDQERFINDVCKLVRYLIDVKYKKSDENALVASGFYDLAKRLYEEKKWSVEDIQRMLEERNKK